jgi:transposase InsO family protein
MWKSKQKLGISVDDTLPQEVQNIFAASRQTYGWRRVHQTLKKKGYKCNHKRIRRVMKELNLIAKVKRKFKATTQSKHGLPVLPNTLNREFSGKKLDEAWVGDITYIATDEGWLYLAVVIDLYSRKVKGWSMSERMTADLVVSALDMAFNRSSKAQNTLFHSDRGVQYASNAYQACLKEKQIQCSMSRKGNCWDNAVAESFFGTLKQELIYHCQFKTRENAQKIIFEYIEVFYNRQRLHSALGYKTPNEVEHAALAA